MSQRLVFHSKGLVNGKQLTNTALKTTSAPCGSEPARESDPSVDINGECQTAFASRLAPTGDLQWLKILCSPLNQEEKISV
ncbi:binding-protein dependent transport system inner membrane protein [Pseudomonas mandelii JR-1]|uniref:Binding-protein dependent transport system inner membrane protein n=1 Tax=Pseudomonas mandelii JR-1 TaxID=1147786 RepID=A0A024EH49_9PSED|nr:binding-protein dependent transport system inner membrane protein [Pseudomonas mandelii JR-1]